MVSPAPVITLSNGIRIANFSSPHPFNFEDGNELPGCQPDRVRLGALERTAIESVWLNTMEEPDDRIWEVNISFKLSHAVWDLLVEMENDPNIDIVLIPYPVLECLREAGKLTLVRKVGTIMVKDRVTKVIYINKFCR